MPAPPIRDKVFEDLVWNIQEWEMADATNLVPHKAKLLAEDHVDEVLLEKSASETYELPNIYCRNPSFSLRKKLHRNHYLRRWTLGVAFYPLSDFQNLTEVAKTDASPTLSRAASANTEDVTPATTFRLGDSETEVEMAEIPLGDSWQIISQLFDHWPRSWQTLTAEEVQRHQGLTGGRLFYARLKSCPSNSGILPVGTVSIHLGQPGNPNRNQPTWNSQGCVGLYDLHVHPQFRGLGLGTLLARFALNEAKRHGRHGCGLVSEPRLIGFYEQLGFQPLGRLERWTRTLHHGP